MPDTESWGFHDVVGCCEDLVVAGGMSVGAQPKFSGAVVDIEGAKRNVGDAEEGCFRVEKDDVFMHWLSKPGCVRQSIVSGQEICYGIGA